MVTKGENNPAMCYQPAVLWRPGQKTAPWTHRSGWMDFILSEWTGTKNIAMGIFWKIKGCKTSFRRQIENHLHTREACGINERLSYLIFASCSSSAMVFCSCLSFCTAPTSRASSPQLRDAMASAATLQDLFPPSMR